MESSKPLILLTGASSGLGLCLAKFLAQKNEFRLVLTAREESLKRFEVYSEFKNNSNIIFRPLEVTNSEQRETLIAELNEIYGGVDILINNAGITYRSVVEHVEEKERIHQMETNFRSPMELTRLVLPKMREKRKGKIINISSVSGMMAMPTMSVYSASKFALEGASESLWYEVKPWNVHVTLIQPGFIRSSSFHNTLLTHLSADALKNPKNPYFSHYKHMSKLIEKLMTYTVSTEENISKCIYKVIQSKKPSLRVPATFDAKLFYIFRRLVPQRFYHILLYKLLPKVKEWGS